MYKCVCVHVEITVRVFVKNFLFNEYLLKFEYNLNLFTFLYHSAIKVSQKAHVVMVREKTLYKTIE